MELFWKKHVDSMGWIMGDLMNGEMQRWFMAVMSDFHVSGIWGTMDVMWMVFMGS
jgi:hypothetical protein